MSLSSQHLNLLDEHVRPPRQRYGAAQGFAALGLLALLLTTLDLGLRWGARDRRTQTLAVQSELSAMQARVGADSTLAPLLAEQAQHLSQLRQQDEALQGLIGAIAAGTAGRPEGYSAWLHALWRQGGADPVWLTGFKTDGREMEIAGSLLNAADLPTYLRRLEGEQLFRGRHFAQLKLVPNAANENISDFSLGASETGTAAETTR